MTTRDQYLAANEGVASRAAAARCPTRRRVARARHRDIWRSARGVVAMEFAILSIPFFVLVLGTLEICYDLFTQSALDSALYTAMRDLQTGNSSTGNSTASTAGNSFITTYLCPAMGGLLECSTSNVFINVQQFDPQAIAGSNATTDYYDITTGKLPVSGNTLVPTSFQGAGDFCVVNPGNFILVSAIYVGPSFIGGLLPNVLSVQYNGKLVHATLSTYGVATENFAKPVQGGTNAPPLCP